MAPGRRGWWSAATPATRLGDSIYEARLYVRGAVKASGRTASRRRWAPSTWRSSPLSSPPPGIDARSRRLSPLRLAGGLYQFRRRERWRVLRSDLAERTPALAAAHPPRVATLRPYHHRRHPPGGRDRASTTSAAAGRSAALPHFDDLLFLGASMSRYPLEGYRERCYTDVVLGDRFASKPCDLTIPVTIAGMSFGALSAPRQGGAGPRRQRGRHLDDHRRRRHDAGGARPLRARSSTSCCRRATA